MWTDTRVRRYGGVTLVEVVVENDGRRPRRVRIASELDGPVWPPRTEGLPEAEWDGDAISARVDPGECRSFGFASPAEPVDPPVSVTADPVATDGGGPVTPADVVRTLGDPRPPRDAVGLPAVGSSDRRDPDPGRGAGRNGATGGRTGPGDQPRLAAERGTGSDRNASTEADRPSGGDVSGVGPPAVRAWLAAVEAGIGSDGEDGSPAWLPEPDALRAVAARAGSLADRIEATDRADGVNRS